MAGEKLRNIRKQLVRNARFLDVARWNYHFENGSHTAVLKALYAYQNADGGFGHGLEPDNQLPASTPVATWFAIEVLRELDFPEEASGMIDKVVAYLVNTKDFDGLRWRATVKGNDYHPCAPWWKFQEDDGFGYNPTAALLGFLLRFAPPASNARTIAESTLDAMLPAVMADDYTPGPHEVANFVTLREDLEAFGMEDRFPDRLYGKLLSWVEGAIDKDTALYRDDYYYISPDLFIKSKKGALYEMNREICSFYVDFIEASVPNDGTWPVNWTWGEEPLPPDVLRDWRGSLATSKMLFIQRMTD